ncbi:MAG: cation-translocating P-type ATPase [Candidatus Zambryskibacteria bacterium]|nr:cation-translocating P-type ATPase [Candidatus Zambryskibacteria bacterium]
MSQLNDKNVVQESISERVEDNNKTISRKIYFNEGLIAVLLFTLIYYSLGKINLYSFDSLIGEISNILIITVSIIGIIPVIISATQALIKKTITIDLLASIALIFTIIQGEWVSAAFINLMLSSARLFSAFTERRTEHIIFHLLKLRPVVVKVQEGEYFIKKSLKEINVGDIVLVESGDRIPIDGEVIKGQASVDQSTLTGESEPISIVVGSQVLSSTLCLSGSLFVRAQKVGEDTTLSKMIKLVDEASRAKTKAETIANKFSAWYIFLTILGVIVLYFSTRNLNLVLSVLLVTCADDLAVAIPLGFSVSISKAAKHGIIIKGASVMERLKDITTFVTDKTGTLTKGVSMVVKVVSANNSTITNCLMAGAICAMGSKHPVSKAILEYAKKERIEVHAPDEFREYPGEGVWSKHEGVEYLQGKISFLTRNGVEISESEHKKISDEESSGMSIGAVAINKKFAGFIVLADDIKKYAKEAIMETRELGVKNWIMLTGDNKQVAERVSKAIGIEEFHANLKPAEKVEYIKKLKHEHGVIAMMGDGVNDAASLAIADVSFAMGAIGSDTSIEAADIAIMHDDLRRVPEAIFLSREALIILKQNFGIWALSNAIGLGLVFGGFLNPAGAALFNFLTDFFPILNVFRIYNLKINKHTYDE